MKTNRKPLPAFTAIAALMLALPCAQGSSPQNSAAFRDPLDTPAEHVGGALHADHEPMLSVTRAGTRWIAVGLRGLILASDDGGASWRQMPCPVQSDLTFVQFSTAKSGWITGHEGVILHTQDGGQSWVRQLDGRIMAQSLASGYQHRFDAGETTLKPVLDELLLNTQAGPTLPFLSVYFQDEQTGYAVGSFGMIVMTADGGQTWQPWLDHIDNPGFLNLNDIRNVGGELYIVGEKGSAFRLDREQNRFVAIATGDAGSLFGITGDADYLLAFGLGGNAWRSTDRGASWTAVDSGVHNTLTAGALSADGERLLLASDSGDLLLSSDRGLHFKTLPAAVPMLFSSLTAVADSRFVVAGYQGLAQQTALADH